MGPCAKNDPTSIDIVKITGTRQDGAVRGKAALTLRQTFISCSKGISDAILRFSEMLKDRPAGSGSESAGAKTAKRQSTHVELVNHDASSSSLASGPPTGRRAQELRDDPRKRMDSPPMPSAAELDMMMSSSDEEEAAPAPPPAKPMTRTSSLSSPAGSSPAVRAAARRASLREEGTSSFRNDPKMSPYLRMLKMHMPDVALRHKMASSGVSEAEIVAFLSDKPLASSKASVTAVAEFDFEGDPDDAEQLPIKAGERVTVLEKFDDGWWSVKNAGGKTGIVPADFMKAP